MISKFNKGRSEVPNKVKPIDGIWLTTSPDSFRVFVSVFRERAGTLYGEAAEELGAVEDLPGPDIAPSEAVVGSWPYEMDRELAKAEIKRHSILQENRKKLFNDILLHVSLQSEQRIKMHEGFNAALENLSPRMLWAILCETQKQLHYQYSSKGHLLHVTYTKKCAHQELDKHSQLLWIPALSDRYSENYLPQ